MARPSTVFVCSECGGESLRWAGQCPHCQAWNTLSEFKVVEARRGREAERSGAPPRAVPLTEVRADAPPRRVLDCGELHRLLPCGTVPASLVLVAAHPDAGNPSL